MKRFKTIIYLAIAIFFLSLSFNLFQAPNGLVTGGVTGIVLILNEQFNVDIPHTTLLINATFLLLGYLFLGKEFFFKTVLGSIVFYPFFLGVIPEVSVSSDMLVNALLGGIIMGVGVSFLFLSKGSSGGTSLLSRILIKYVNIPFATAIFLFDGTIILFGFAIFGIESGVYALIVVATSTLIANYIEQKFSSFNQLILINNEPTVNNVIIEMLEESESIVSLQDNMYLCVLNACSISGFKTNLL